MMKKEDRTRLNTLKGLFNVKPTWNIVEHLITDMMNDRLKRNWNDGKAYVDSAKRKIDDIIYLLKPLKQSNALSSFQCYKVFKTLLYAEKELQYFNDTIGDIKDYDPQRVRDLVDKAKPFIVGKIETRIPQNPNYTYNDIYFELLDDYQLKKNDILNLLSIIYNMDKKAKMPKKDIDNLTKLKEAFYLIIMGGGKDKGLTDEEIKKELEEINNESIFKNFKL